MIFLLLFAGFGFLFLGIASWQWFAAMRRKRLVQDLPTRKAAGIVLGLNEVVANADPAQAVTSPNAGVSCVWWKEERYKQTKSSDGKTK